MHPEAKEELRKRLKLTVIEYAKHFGATNIYWGFNIPLLTAHHYRHSLLNLYALVQLLTRRIARHPTVHTSKRVRLWVCLGLVPPTAHGKPMPPVG